MKSLQTYLIENLDNSTIEEGKILDAIKEWFKNLFSPSKKKFDRYNPENQLIGTTLSDYKEYLKENFDIKNIDLKNINFDELKKIVYPNGNEPSIEDKVGFYDFIDNIDNKDKDTDYIAYIYQESNIKDTACLINCIKSGKKIELLKIQVINEFENLLTIKEIIRLLKSNKELIEDIKEIFIKENTNKNLYKQLINDCDFESKYDENRNINIAKIIL